MNKQSTLQELWTIKDETAANFNSVAAYFEHLKHLQKIQTKLTKSSTPSGIKAQTLTKRRRLVAMH